VRLKPLPAVRLETQPEQVGAKKAAASNDTDGEYADGQAAERAKSLYRLRWLEEQLSVARAREDVEFDFFFHVGLDLLRWSGAKDDELSRFIAAPVQLETDRDLLETELALARSRSTYTPAQMIAQQA